MLRCVRPCLIPAMLDLGPSAAMFGFKCRLCYDERLPLQIRRSLPLAHRCEEFMKAIHVGRFSFSAPYLTPYLGWLKVAALAALLFGLPINCGAAHASTAHVYLVRGVLNIFSLGMDEIAAKLQQQGIAATVHNHMMWASIADDAAAEYRSGRVQTIVLVGHSSGATVLPDIVARLDQQGVPVKLAIGLGFGVPYESGRARRPLCEFLCRERRRDTCRKDQGFSWDT